MLGSQLCQDRIGERTLQHVLSQSLILQRGLVRWTVYHSRDSFAGRLGHLDGPRNYTLDYIVPELFSQFSLDLLSESGSSIVHCQKDEEIEIGLGSRFYHSDQSEQGWKSVHRVEFTLNWHHQQIASDYRVDCQNSNIRRTVKQDHVELSFGAREGLAYNEFTTPNRRQLNLCPCEAPIP